MDFLSSEQEIILTVLPWGAVIGASLCAAAFDMKQRRIPNALTFPLLAAGLIWSGCFGGLSGLGRAFGACLLLSLPYVLLFLFAGGGAGDAKLMGAIGSWLGLHQSVVVLLCVASTGFLLALAKATIQKRLRFILTNVFVTSYTFLLCVVGGRKPKIEQPQDVADAESHDRLEVPYGVAIAVGVCVAAAVVALWGTEWLRLW